MKLLKRGFIFVMLFALSGVGVTFAAGQTNDNIQNFFLGNAPATSGDLNQVVLQVLQVLQVEMVLLALTVKMDAMELMAHQVLQVHKAQLVHQAPLWQL